MNSYSVEGIVIKRHNLGEADKLITLFTPDHGKITVMAKGIRKLSSKRAGSLELFNLVKAAIVKGRGDLDTLTEVQTLHTFSSWRKHLGRVTLAYQLAEVVDKLTPDRQPHPRVFEILKNSLSQIGNLKIDWKTKIDQWLLNILIDLGYWPLHKPFTGDIQSFMEDIANRPLHSHKLLNRLK